MASPMSGFQSEPARELGTALPARRGRHFLGLAGSGDDGGALSIGLLLPAEGSASSGGIFGEEDVRWRRKEVWGSGTKLQRHGSFLPPSSCHET